MTLDVYLSPHFDDAVLSCGGAIARASDAGADSLVMTTFGGAMPDGFVPGSLVRSLHARSGVLTNLVAERRREDEVALRLLGASGTFLDYPVASYRVLPDGRAPDSRALWRDLNPDDERLVWAILADVAPRIAAEATIHAPIGLGGHVDHRIVRRVGQALADQGRRVVWYEDLPYAARSSRRVLADTTANLSPVLRLLSSDQLARKVRAVAAYSTQVRLIWGWQFLMAWELRRYARRVGGGTPAEREWTHARRESGPVTPSPG